MSVKLLGFKIDDYTFQEALDNAESLVKENKVSQVITINPEMIQNAESDKDFAHILNEAEMVIPDGIGIKIGLRINGYNVDRIPGIDFARKLLEIAGEKNIPVAIIGSKEEVINSAIINLQKEISGLNIVYIHNGYFDNDNDIYKDIRNSLARIILVAMGSPRQEEFIYNAKEVLDFGLMVGIGGSLDVWSGNVKRAPILFQKMGLEWLYRTINQPARFKRIFPALPLFILKVLKYKYKQ